VRIGGQKGAKLLDETVVLKPVRLHERFEERDRRRDRAMLLPLDPLEEGGTPSSVARVVLDEVDQDIGVEADCGVAS
jgi:hypothetical protein